MESTREDTAMTTATQTELRGLRTEQAELTDRATKYLGFYVEMINAEGIEFANAFKAAQVNWMLGRLNEIRLRLAELNVVEGAAR